MDVDLIKIITNNIDAINIDIQICFDDEQLKRANIRELKDAFFKGKIRKLYDSEYEIKGVISGIMVLADDITLEDVYYNFNVSVLENFNEFDCENDEKLKIINNKLDISEFLWQNIVLEIPSKIVNDKNTNINLKGNGWRFITEEELEKEKITESPFSELDNNF